jgi:hypothetical protein
MMATRV